MASTMNSGGSIDLNRNDCKWCCMKLNIVKMDQEHRKRKRIHFKVVRFIIESGIKLHMKSVPMATASLIYHKFFSVCDLDDYDPYLIATTAIYLAGKVEEEHLRLRDVINVTYRTLHKDKPPLDVNSTYWALRESVVNCELLLLRVPKFHVSFHHPHKYMLHYLKSLENWFEPALWRRTPVAKTAWAILRDSYHGDMCLHYRATHMAVAIIYFTLQLHGLEVPCSQEGEKRWWETLTEDLKFEKIKDIISAIMDIYDMETSL